MQSVGNQFITNAYYLNDIQGPLTEQERFMQRIDVWVNAVDGENRAEIGDYIKEVVLRHNNEEEFAIRSEDVSIAPPMPSHVKYARIQNCTKITALPDILPTQLVHLIVSGCRSMKLLPQLPDTLEKLSLEDCRGLTELPPSPPANLTELSIKICVKLKEIPQSWVKQLKILHVCSRTLTLLPDSLPLDLEIRGLNETSHADLQLQKLIKKYNLTLDKIISFSNAIMGGEISDLEKTLENMNKQQKIGLFNLYISNGIKPGFGGFYSANSYGNPIELAKQYNHDHIVQFLVTERQKQSTYTQMATQGLFNRLLPLEVCTLIADSLTSQDGLQVAQCSRSTYSKASGESAF